jgi:DNA-binding transcriptional ArsR family regulator
MNAETQTLYKARARIIKAMAHPTRLFIVDHLSRGMSCVADLTKLIGADMSTVSKHLTVLKAAGIVDDRKQGAQVYYTLRVPCVMNFFGCVESILRSNSDRQLRLVK